MNKTESSKGPVAIRYANSSECETVREHFYSNGDYSLRGVRADYGEENIPDSVFITYGNISSKVIGATNILKEKGIRVGIVLVEQLKPYGVSVERIAPLIEGAKCVLFVEEGILAGGYSMIAESMLRLEHPELSSVSFDIAAIDDSFAIPEEICDIYDHLGLSAKRLAERMIDQMSKNN